MPIAECGRYSINYVEDGAGAPVLLIHGLAGDLSAWKPQMAALKDRYRVIAFDNPGSGGSSTVPNPTSTAELAETTLALMDHLGLDAAHVIGRSMGGAVGQMMALQAPERVKSLGLAASFAKLDPVGDRVIAQLDHLLTRLGNWTEWAPIGSIFFVSPKFFNENPQAMARIEALVGDEGRDQTSYHNLARAVREHDCLARFGEIRCPVLIMAGRQDPICSMTATKWMQDALPSAETVIFEDSSHFFLMEEAPKAMRALEDWLARQARAA